ncbi:hypothetical protein DUZ99_00135 [Xylanibacillus composti]|uniref:YkwD family protein n=1 Tax=Xylanibacillus composti TaxID=1572762 RepID=A0A8J4M2H3_9BACL|nr:peptidoglycan-binding protein [Xylanibacillus composti]MDT9723423.1 hypothetical protein [Xylanibacillus composti]GIQ68541.1 hypothetical protein XYCOK13_13650 [Xylanibacillus composti]
MHTRIRVAALAAITLFLVLGHPTVHGFGKGASGPDVYAVQAMLKSIGYYSGPIDGQYGPLTERGVRLFQSRYGLPATGAVDTQTLQSILWAYAEAKIPQRTQPPAKEQPPAQPPGKVPSISTAEQRMVNLVNQERQKAGLHGLKVNTELSRVARFKSADMIENDYFAHESPTYGSPFDMMRNFGITYRAAAENLACNSSVDAAHEALMNSPGHRANILNATYTEIGVGIVDGGMCGQMYTQMFIAK